MTDVNDAIDMIGMNDPCSPARPSVSWAAANSAA